MVPMSHGHLAGDDVDPAVSGAELDVGTSLGTLSSPVQSEDADVQDVEHDHRDREQHHRESSDSQTTRQRDEDPATELLPRRMEQNAIAETDDRQNHVDRLEHDLELECRSEGHFLSPCQKTTRGRETFHARDPKSQKHTIVPNRPYLIPTP